MLPGQQGGNMKRLNIAQCVGKEKVFVGALIKRSSSALLLAGGGNVSCSDVIYRVDSSSSCELFFKVNSHVGNLVLYCVSSVTEKYTLKKRDEHTLCVRSVYFVFYQFSRKPTNLPSLYE